MGLTWYYLIQSAYNIEAIINLVELSFKICLQCPYDAKMRQWRSPLICGWSSTCRGDFREMAIHHVITNMLIMTSSFFRFTRIGSIVFVLHDISDIPVDLSKLANFVKWKIATTSCFITLLIFWVIMRLLILPLVVIKSVLYDSPVLIAAIPSDPLYHVTYLTVFKLLLIAIFSLHGLWFVILVRIALRLALKGEAHDLSEHKKGENQSLLLINSVISVAEAPNQHHYSEKQDQKDGITCKRV